MIIGPPRMPPAVLAQLNRALVATVGEAAIRERLVQAGVAPWSGANTPEVARDFLAAEIRRYQEVVARTGIRLER
jgi:tripartite-type tricarboxylate transporter receptor subunit TctC